MGRYFKINAKFVDITNKACIIFLPDGRQEYSAMENNL